jgi:transcriptional regulator with XRE-family HTH domain
MPRVEKHPVDILVGKRIRAGRHLRGVTQQDLGEAIGVKFQQVQKYETGANRVSASKLMEIARTLDMPITYFFGQLETGVDDVLDPQVGRLLRLVAAMDERRRQALMDMAESMAKVGALSKAA